MGSPPSMMALFFVVLLLFPLVCLIPAGGSEQPLAHSSNCGLGKENYGVPSDGFVRYLVNRDPVGRGLICDALRLMLSNGCAVDGERRKIAEEYCSFGSAPGSSAVGLDSLTEVRHRISRRKIFLGLAQNGAVGFKHRRGQWREGNGRHGDSPLSSKGIVVALPAAFLLCCAFLCPCFQKKERDISDEFPLNGTGSGRDHTFSEFPRHYGRTPGSSQRSLWSPRRAPPSPLRISPGPSRFATTDQSSMSGPIQINLKQIRKATQNFSESHVIGEGGFGKVYKAELPNGVVVAIKRANKEHFALLHDEFRNEVQFLSQIDHQNLVRLLGYIEQENERIIISEYVTNGSLREHLDGRDGRVLDFSQRLSVAIDVAHALTYLHSYAEERPIIHRDVKSTNILLTENLRAKVADFGFAKAGPTGEDQTHILTAVRGTAGYTDPEYLRTYQLTPKSDVFSFGALLVEIISGRRPLELQRPLEERVTVRWAFKQDKQEKTREILDPKLEEAVDGETLSRLLQLAFDCVAPTRDDRPTMREVVERLWDIRKGYGRSRSAVSLPSQ